MLKFRDLRKKCLKWQDSIYGKIDSFALGLNHLPAVSALCLKLQSRNNFYCPLLCIPNNRFFCCCCCCFSVLTVLVISTEYRK